MTPRRRLDTELVRRGLASSRSDGRRLIAEGRVTVGGAPAPKPARLVAPAEPVGVAQPADRWASRGGHKLAGALGDLCVDPAGRHCLDAGASTGGFTDVLLRRGAARVVAVDVGYGQLAWGLRRDERVVVRDRTNVRRLTAGDVLPPPPDLLVADLSFISLTLVLPALVAVAADVADHVALVKPQFEVGPRRVGPGGVVRDPAAWRGALSAVAAAAGEEGLGVVDAVASRLPGPAGNVEFFVHLRAGDSEPGSLAAEAGQPDVSAVLDRAVAAGRRVAVSR
ncbi:MAG: TlyA family RNA methyltransferase [Actinobacteria bacterium]|nr:TlyA family RNA methyltransferase [Actinomycetota bacterium]